MNDVPDGLNPPEITPPAPAPESIVPVEPPSPAGQDPLPPVLPAVEPVPPPATPPLLSTFQAAQPEPEQKASLGLVIATVAVGILQLILALMVTSTGTAATNVSYRIGAVLGATTFWPLIVLGLFSLGKRFRTTRNRLIILLVVWSFCVLGHIGNLTAPVKSPISAKNGAAAVDETAAGESADDAADSSEKKDEGEPLKTVTPVSSAKSTEDFDFSPGSDKRLIAIIDGAQKGRYHEIVAAYEQACTRHPDDAVLALERVQFVARYADSEDLEIEGAQEDHKVALRYLTTRFPQAPGTILYQLGRTNFKKLEDLAKSYEKLTVRWNDTDHAAFLLLRAQAAETNGQVPAALVFARKSFALNPTIAAGLLLAAKTHENKDDPECLKVLLHPIFDKAEPWTKKQKLGLLLKIHEPERAGKLYAELKAGTANAWLDVDIATAMAKAGKISEAREIFIALMGNQWSRKQSSLDRFVFELEYGTEMQAMAAYRVWRETGLKADPFLRYRLALFRRHPGAAWNADDFVGAGLLVGLLVLAAMLPLGVLMPVHYWSLLREKRGKPPGWPDAAWDLKQAWLLMAVLMVTDVGALWFLRPEVMRSWLLKNERMIPDVLGTPTYLTVQSAVWCALSLVLVYLFARSRAWRLIGPGHWQVGRCIGLGVACAIGLRIFLGLYIRIWPAAAAGELAATLSETNKLSVEILGSFGVLGLLGVVALFVPLLEECLHRGVLLQAVGKHVPFFWANTVQALLFALLHENYRLIPFFFLFGFTCGELARRSDGLLAGLTIHICNNALACLGIILVQHRLGQ